MGMSNGEPRQNSVENSEYTITLKVFFCLFVENRKLLLGHSNSGVLGVTINRKVVVYCPAIGGQKDSRCFPSTLSFSVVESHRMLVINGV